MNQFKVKIRYIEKKKRKQWLGLSTSSLQHLSKFRDFQNTEECFKPYKLHITCNCTLTASIFNKRYWNHADSLKLQSCVKTMQ